VQWEKDSTAITPGFNKLINEGVYFDRIYATGDRTDKGIVGILSGYPAQPIASIIKIPTKAAQLPMLSKTFKANKFRTSFFYGGELEFANMKAYLVQGQFDEMVSVENFEALPELSKYAFAVDFITPVDEYQQNERASKYGFLVIGLTFLIFFLIQSISKISIHIFQYCMIGIALIMFYTLLISITEHSSFSFAYTVAGISVMALISLYSISILKDKKFPTFIAVSLSVLYTFIYVIIQLEDYALLVGSIGLFLILASVMYFSRKIEWNK
jgi:hypothetical protein